MSDFHFKESTRQSLTCPLGSICAECSWSVKMFEETPGGKTIEAGNMCALVSNALMADRMGTRIDSLQKATESFRNEMVKIAKQPIQITDSPPIGADLKVIDAGESRPS